MEIKIGTEWTDRRGNKNVVVDIYTTTNSKGETVSKSFVCESVFCGQTVTNYDVCFSTIARAICAEKAA